MFLLFVTLVVRGQELEFSVLGPCYLYDRYCLETIWKPIPLGTGVSFGKDLMENNWRKTPELHYKNCFTGPTQCKESGISLVCKTADQTEYETTFTSESLEGGDYATFYTYIDGLPEGASDICVTLEATIGDNQPRDPDSGSMFVAKYISQIRNIQPSTGCRSSPASVHQPLSSIATSSTSDPTTTNTTTTPTSTPTSTALEDDSDSIDARTFIMLSVAGTVVLLILFILCLSLVFDLCCKKHSSALVSPPITLSPTMSTNDDVDRAAGTDACPNAPRVETSMYRKLRKKLRRKHRTNLKKHRGLVKREAKKEGLE
eukprot:GEMP01029617.1.p1 GENE.GEMP01029617.1~~GEMP01029617.1.p1  ORF type:complete len:316 (+),score=75.11 GEMP01029617.1:443-1390(+)